MLFVTLPIMALVAVIGLLAEDDLQEVRQLDRYAEEIADVGDLASLRTSLQEERHLLINADAPTVLVEPLSAQMSSPIVNALGLGSNVDVVQVLPVARQLAANGELEQAAAQYTSIIDELTQVIERRLAMAPLGQPTLTAGSLEALLTSQEEFLREDLELFLGSADTLTLSRHRQSGVLGLTQFTTHSSPQGRVAFQEITSSSAWNLLNSVEAVASVEAVTVPGNESLLTQWKIASDVRRLSLIDLVTTEVERAQESMIELRDAEIARLASLGGVIAAILAIAAIGTFILRRSIIRPLSKLTVHARNLSKGEVTRVDDPAGDEIAEVGHAFSSVASTVDHLFRNIAEVSDSVHHGIYSTRIDTDPLEGDWLRLANTMNQTLDTGEAHYQATSEELARRSVLEEISNAAMLATDAATITTHALRHLPKALAGSHAHIHQHPSGPPSVDLGVPLEPAFSALEVPTVTEHAQKIRVGRNEGVASLIEFPEGPPAVLVLMFGRTAPAQIGPLTSLVETTSRILAQAHRRQIAEIDATHNLEHDLTTGLANVAYLQRWFSTASAPAEGWTAIGVAPQNLVDLDGSFGRDAYDLVLRAVGLELNEIVEATAAHYGMETRLVRVGEPEFVAVVPTTVGEVVANTFASRFVDPIDVGNTSLSVDATIGMAEVDPGDSDLTEAMANVAIAVRRGQQRTTEIIPFEIRYREDARRRTQLTLWLEQALENRDLMIHFQPIVNAYTTTIEGYECLIRGSLDGEPVSPGEFIPLAEETGMISTIGEFVLREACAAVPFLRGDNPYVAVNLSPLELSDPALLERIATVLDESNVARERVVFEVTEGAETSAADAELLGELRDLGVKIAIDDFGSGHANLAYLNSLPAQILKLDRSLITPMVDDPGAASVVLKAIEMAHGLGMSVVGEGVETNEELDALRRVRCDRIQGWFTGRPAPLEDFIEITVERPLTQISQPRDSQEVQGR